MTSRRLKTSPRPRRLQRAQLAGVGLAVGDDPVKSWSKARIDAGDLGGWLSSAGIAAGFGHGMFCRTGCDEHPATNMQIDRMERFIFVPLENAIHPGEFRRH